MAKKTTTVPLAASAGWTPITTTQLNCFVQLRSGFDVEVAVAATTSELEGQVGHPLRGLPGNAIGFSGIVTGDKVFARTLNDDAALLVTGY